MALPVAVVAVVSALSTVEVPATVELGTAVFPAIPTPTIQDFAWLIVSAADKRLELPVLVTAVVATPVVPA